MNFNLYLDDQTAKELDQTAEKLGETRSGLIRKALREGLDKKTLGSPGWPSLILEWQAFLTSGHSKRIAANCCHRVKMPFREIPPRHQCAERLRTRRTGCDGAAPPGGATAIGGFGDHGDEVEYGLARNPNLAPRTREAMRMLLSTISVLPFEREDARVAAQLRASLNSQDTPIGAYDLLLAACALRRGLKIVTHNAQEFVRVGGLGLEDWHGP
jgi:predicted nucleic acid-binding protein/predicted transcriptional regulator